MGRILGTLVAVIWLVYCAPTQAQLFQIANPQFSKDVLDDGNYTLDGPAIDVKISRSKLSDSTLYFSFAIVGLEPAIKYLRQEGHLDAFVIFYAGLAALTRIECGIIQTRWREIRKKILDKYSSEGVFTFRTFAFTQQTEYDYLLVIVKDVNNNEIGRATINLTP